MRFDNGKEYINDEVLSWLESQGINWELTAPHSSFQNGVAKRLNLTLLGNACAMLFSTELHISLWPEAIAYVCYIKNQSPVRALQDQNMTPYKVFHHRKPDISALQPFGTPL